MAFRYRNRSCLITANAAADDAAAPSFEQPPTRASPLLPAYPCRRRRRAPRPQGPRALPSRAAPRAAATMSLPGDSADGWPFLRWLDDPQELESRDPADPFALGAPASPVLCGPPAAPPLQRNNPGQVVAPLSDAAVPPPSLLPPPPLPPPPAPAPPPPLPPRVLLPPRPLPAAATEAATAAAVSDVLVGAARAAERAKLRVRRALKRELGGGAPLDAAARGKLRSRREAAVSRANKLEYSRQLERIVGVLVRENIRLSAAAGEDAVGARVAQVCAADADDEAF